MHVYVTFGPVGVGDGWCVILGAYVSVHVNYADIECSSIIVRCRVKRKSECVVRTL